MRRLMNDGLGLIVYDFTILATKGSMATLEYTGAGMSVLNSEFLVKTGRPLVELGVTLRVRP